MKMLKALKRLISDMDETNITTGVAKSINVMAGEIAFSNDHTPRERDWAFKVYSKSGRAYSKFVPTLKGLLKEI